MIMGIPTVEVFFTDRYYPEVAFCMNNDLSFTVTFLERQVLKRKFLNDTKSHSKSPKSVIDGYRYGQDLVFWIILLNNHALKQQLLFSPLLFSNCSRCVIISTSNIY